MSNVYQLQPDYAYVPLTATSAALLSEADSHIVYGRVLIRIFELLDGKRNEDEIVDALAAEFSGSEIFYHLTQLASRGYIECTDPNCDPAAALALSVPPNTWPPPVTKVPSGSVRIIDYGSEPLTREKLERLLTGSTEFPASEPAGAKQQLTVVLIDDYLDPRLAEFANEAASAGLQWLPFKAIGVRPWFGPRLGGSGDPCFGCLIARLRRNRSIEAWHIDHTPDRQPLRLSRRRSAASIAAAAGWLAFELAQNAAESDLGAFCGHLVSIDMRSSAIIRHRADRYDHCPACSHPAGGEIGHAPLVLQSRRNLASHENGSRVQTQSQTTAELEPLISPLLGVIQSVGALTDVPPELGYPHLARFSVPIDAGFFDRKRALLPTGGNGKGFSPIQGRLSAICEGIERASAYCDSTVQFVRKSATDLGASALPPHVIYGCSEAHYIEWSSGCAVDPVFGPVRYKPTTPLLWVPAWSFSRGETKMVPANFVHFAVPPEDGNNYADAATNGLASGTCLEEAILHGLLEVIERDAATVWWCNRVPRPGLDFDSFMLPEVPLLQRFLDRSGWDLEVLDITHDYCVPVFVAVARHRTDPNEVPRMGFGADLDAQVALSRAITEMGQSWYWIPRFRLNELCLSHDPEPISAAQYVVPDSSARRGLADFPTLATGDLRADIEVLIARAGALGHEVVVVNLTRPGFGLQVARVLVTGMCRFWPRFETQRLLLLPAQLGWLPKPRSSEQLNRLPFFYSNCGLRLDEWLSQ